MANIFTYCFYGRDPKKIYFVIPSSLFYIIFAIAVAKSILSTHLKTFLEVIAESILSAHLFFFFLVAIAKSILTSNLLCYLQRRYENLFCQHIFFSIYRSDQNVTHLFGLNYYAVFCLQYSNITDNSYLYYLKSSKLVVLRNRKVIHKISCSVKLYYLYIP